jgi:hypothetical protein
MNIRMVAGAEMQAAAEFLLDEGYSAPNPIKGAIVLSAIPMIDSIKVKAGESGMVGIALFNAMAKWIREEGPNRVYMHTGDERMAKILKRADAQEVGETFYCWQRNDA